MPCFIIAVNDRVTTLFIRYFCIRHSIMSTRSFLLVTHVEKRMSKLRVRVEDHFARIYFARIYTDREALM